MIRSKKNNATGNILWNGIVPVTAPRMAPGDALEGEPTALQGAVPAKGLQGVFGAGGSVAARRHGEGRDAKLVELHQQDKGERQRLFQQRGRFHRMPPSAACAAERSRAAAISPKMRRTLPRIRALPTSSLVA